MKKIFAIALAAIFLIITDVSSQSRGVCGTIDKTLADRVEHNRKHYSSMSRSEDIIYVPIKFHSTAKDNGSGRVKYSAILNQICRLNEDYLNSDANVIYYIQDGVNEIDNSAIYSSSGNPAVTPLMKAQKNGPGKNAMNIFITENADHDGQSLGVTLGYYTSAYDWVVIRKQELVSVSSTLTHEGGHFLSLPHTFYGWEFGEGDPYDPQLHGDTVNLVNCPGTSLPIELMDRSNCEFAADKFCDTPPDFNFGFGNQCNFNYDVWDRNFDKVIPMKNNYMSYFDNCPDFRFTAEQIGAVRADLSSPERAYLISDYIPNTTAITDTVILNSPSITNESGQYEPTHYDNVTIDWNPVPGASRYLLQVSKGSTTNSYILNSNQTSKTFTDWKKNSYYLCVIKPFNEGNTCSEEKNITIHTTGIGTAVKAIKEINNFEISPNPIRKDEMIHVSVDATSNFIATIQISSINGTIVSTHRDINFVSGTNNYDINTSDLSKGLYLITVKNNLGTSTKKIIVQ